MMRIPDPDMTTVLKSLSGRAADRINAVQIGAIESYDTETQSAEVTIQMRHQRPDNVIIDYPLLVDVPVFVLQGGGAYIDMPIEAGDYCLVLFNDRDIDTWWVTGNVAEPPSPRKHSLADGIALVGINPKSSTLGLTGEALGIIAGAHKVNVSNDVEALHTLVGDLIDAVVNIVTTGSPTTHTVSPTSQTQLNAIKTRFENLLGES